MNPGPVEVIPIVFMSLLGMALPLFTLIGVILLYIKLSRIEKMLEEQERNDS